MSLTLREQIDADTAAVFHNVDDFAESVVHYPAGDLAAGVNVDAVVDRDTEDTSGLGLGDGARFDGEDQVTLRRSAVLELAASVTVTESSGTQQTSPSLFQFDGARWRAVRILGRDDAMQSVLVTRLDKIATRRSGRR